MTSSLSLVLLACVACSVTASPFDLSFGGVYKDSSAQDYFQERFGSGFLSGLGAKLRGISRGEAPRKAKVAAVPTRRPVFVVKESSSTESTPSASANVEGVLYRDATAPKTKMEAQDIQSYQEEPKIEMNAQDIQTFKAESLNNDYYYDQSLGQNNDYYYYEDYSQNSLE